MNSAQTRAQYADKFRSLRVHSRRAGQPSPHKVCILLAVLDLLRADIVTENQILFDSSLLERYAAFFNAVKASGDLPNPHYPFFFLQGSLRDGSPSFWHLHAYPGREEVLRQIREVTTTSQVTENIAFASLDPALHKLLQDPDECDNLSAVLAEAWFDRSHTDLSALMKRSAEISRYERTLRTGSVVAKSTLPKYVRDPAFRRVVIRAYDFRCTATGIRIVTPAGEALVEAAHIHPFSEAADDDPRNGLALSRDMHWAMDRNLIAPGPDLKWHVSKDLDSRIPDFRDLCSLDGKPLLPPTETRFTPKLESLQWRMDRLRDLVWMAPVEGEEA